MLLVISGIKAARGENLYELTCGHLTVVGTHMEVRALVNTDFGVDCTICSEMIEP